MIAARDWWRAADPIEVAIVEALGWMGPLMAADLTRVFEDFVNVVLLMQRLRRLVSEGIVEAIDVRRARGIMIRRYRIADEFR